jgi:hypothetical protein
MKEATLQISEARLKLLEIWNNNRLNCRLKIDDANFKFLVDYNELKIHPEIYSLLGPIINISTLYRWKKKYSTHGIDGLKDNY